MKVGIEPGWLGSGDKRVGLGHRVHDLVEWEILIGASVIYVLHVLVARLIVCVKQGIATTIKLEHFGAEPFRKARD